MTVKNNPGFSKKQNRESSGENASLKCRLGNLEQTCLRQFRELEELKCRLDEGWEFDDRLEKTYDKRCNSLSQRLSALKEQTEHLATRTESIANNCQQLAKRVEGIENDFVTLVFGLPCQQAPYFHSEPPCSQVKPS